MTNATNNYTPYTIAGSGVSLFIRPVSSFLFRDIEKQYPAPIPPREQIIRADGSFMETENRAHPDYIAAVREREARVNGMMGDLIVELACMIVLTDEQRDEIKAYRDNFKRITGGELAGSIESQYIKYIALADNSDMVELIRAVMNRMRPDEKKLTSGRITSEQPTEARPYSPDPLEKPESLTVMS